jgi:predicted RNA-binding Zn ribbon-like protein
LNDNKTLRNENGELTNLVDSTREASTTLLKASVAESDVKIEQLEAENKNNLDIIEQRKEACNQ